MLNKHKIRIFFFSVILTCSSLFIAWNPLRPFLKYLTSAMTGTESSIPLPLPNIQVGITGKPAFSLNVQIPPGAGDIAPSVAINYTTSANQSIVGRGWSLSGFPKISKNPGMGIHFGSSDGYSSNILGDFISTGNGGVYRTKIESFYKATFDGTSWVLRDTTGSTYVYGGNNANGSNSIVQGDSGPVAFYLDKARDIYGNGYDITYLAETLNSDEPLPQEIKYTRGNARITFSYSNRSSGWKEQIFFLTNNAIRKKILSKIQVFAKDESGSEQLIETYDLEYTTSDEHGPLLSSFERENYKPVTFKYTERTTDSTILSSNGKTFDISYRAMDPGVQTNCTDTQAACVCSAIPSCMALSWGLAGVACASGIANFQDVCTNGVTTSFVSPADTNGDGVPEIVRVSGSMTNQKFSVTSLSDWENASDNSLSGSNTLVGNHIGITIIGRILPGDYNADGKTDFLVLTNNGDPLKVYYGPNFSSTTYSSVTVQGLGATSNILKQFVADVNGDGKTDYIQADSSNNLVVYTSTGSGFQKLQTLAMTNFGTEFQQFVDLDKNGVPDYVRIDGTTSKDLLVTFLDFQNGSLQNLETTKVSRTDFGKSGDQFINDINGDGYLDFAFFAMSGSQGTISYYPFTGRKFLANGASPLQTINVNKAYAKQVSGSSANTTYVNIDLSGDSVKDQVSYDNSSVSNSFFNVSIYDSTQAKYLTAIKVPWNQDVSSDLNGDGTADTIRADSTTEEQTNSNGVTSVVSVTKFKVTITNGSFLEVPIDLNSYVASSSTSGDSSSMGYFNWRNPKDFSDLNMDGKADFIRYDDSTSTLYVSYAELDSNGFITYSANGDDSWPTGGYMMSLDANGDGKPEIFGMNANKVNLFNSVQSSAPGILTRTSRNFPYESKVELNYIRFNQSLPGGLLTQVKNGSYSSAGDLELNLEYQLLKNHSGAVQPNLYSASYPQFLPFTGADYLVSSVSQKTGDNLLGKISYSFSFSRSYLSGFRNSSYIGFQKIIQKNEISNEVSETRYDPSFIEMAGRPTYQLSSKNGIKLSESTTSYNKSTSIFGGALVQSGDNTQIKYQAGEPLNTIVTSNTYDSYGNESSKCININGNMIVETIAYLNDWNTGLIGKPTEIQIKNNGEIISDKKISYSNSQMTEIKELISGNIWRTSGIQAYDEFGNPTIIQEVSGNINTVEYDPIVHKYPITVTNSLGHITRKSYDFTTGFLTSLTNPNGGISKTEFDVFGRAITGYLPGETDWSEKIEYENTGDLENQIIRKKFRKTTGESWQEEISNSLTGVLKKRSSLTDGLILVEESYQNREGQTIKKIDSYLEGASPISWTTYTYNSEGNLTKSERSDGKVTNISLEGFTSTFLITKNETEIGKLIEVKDSLGKVISRTNQGKTIQFQYGSNGKLSQIKDPENGITTIETDLAGKQTKVINPNSGTTTYTYDNTSGKLEEQRNANGSRVVYSYDILGRPTLVRGIDSNGASIDHIYEYDSTEISNGIGKLSKVTDSLGDTEFGYDIRGNQTELKKHIVEEDLTLLIKKTYNLQNQIEQIVYPDGSITKSIYSAAGYLSGITLTPGNGGGSDFAVVQYVGPIFEDGNLKFQRLLGNGVTTNVVYDPIEKRPVSVQTSKDSEIYESVTYSYDNFGNYIKIDDQKNPTRKQTFIYDNLNRLSSSTGIYGTQEYQYSDSGRLLKKGNLTYSYNDSSHKNAVTQVVGDDITYTYSYDLSGNAINRNGETIEYNPFQKVKNIQTADQGLISFDYDFTGTRIRKVSSTDGSKTISLGGLYEIDFVPGKEPKHTLYFKGAYGDLIGQWTRKDANLITGTVNSDSLTDKTKLAWNTFIGKMGDISISGVKYILFEKESIIVLLCVSIISALCFSLLHTNEGLWNSILKFSAPILILSISNCSVLIPGGNGDTPWEEALIINANTPGVGNGPGRIFPVDGFVFLHPDHLGSITMATDGDGKRITGGTQAGASHVSYEPYGEINRTDSFGPDVFRYKYTGQEEDKETGLYYFKARYYDPLIGRFLQADSIVDGNRPMGMDSYMYTEGNPLRYVDPSGHSMLSAWLSQNGLGMLNFSISLSSFFQNAFYVSSQRWSAFGLSVFNYSLLSLGQGGSAWDKSGQWLDRQAIDPVAHMSTQELIVGGIILAAAIFLAIVVGPEVIAWAGSLVEAYGAGAVLAAQVFASVTFGIAVEMAGAAFAEVLGSLSTSSFNNIHYDKKAGVAMKDIGASAASVGGLYGGLIEAGMSAGSADKVIDAGIDSADGTLANGAVSIPMQYEFEFFNYKFVVSSTINMDYAVTSRIYYPYMNSIFNAAARDAVLTCWVYNKTAKECSVKK
ncbi:RHS repeat-associated core domain-containing protein [Leptospira neocaledonica]|uniref:Type IV secretion protein Rhs n=1 Tax=Leptospira neocaledonica TaxID=2023192 RepID=A0A2N0A3A4_9LEPT|nr:RHS repeat-associated core domain-containing protein [Leptospira neocaledonica]PJZ78794.1 type IV secretion protein Rhs [Leptospira neocaledonica]